MTLEALPRHLKEPRFPVLPPLRPDLPTMYDLPSENPEDPGLDEYHWFQAQILSETCLPHYGEPQAERRYFTGQDLNIYYDPENTNWYKRPDWFLALTTRRAHESGRMSYVVWQEPVNPYLVVEFISSSTKAEDLGEKERKGAIPTKWEVYERILKIPYYVVYDGAHDDLRIFRLENGAYCAQPVDQQLYLPEINLSLGLSDGGYND